MSAEDDTTALRLDAVSIELGGQPILERIELSVAPGEIVALVGRNGAGKTTLLRVASRVLAPARGTVRVDGTEIERISRPALARALAVVPQETQIAFPFTAGEVVLMGRSPHLGLLGFETRADVERARAAMERVGIADLADRSVLALSGGERQLVLVARALAQDTRVLLLDEPTAHLDLRHRIEMLELVREFVAGGRSALVVSHDLGLAARGCDRMALLADGSVLEAGPPGDVLTPERLRRAFGIEADVIRAPDGAPLVIPRTGASR